jgi:putative Ca2+/H+ antiporter (TMEM165/GDT1 family)
MCTGLAVLGGRLLAARISERVVAFAGGVLFLIFALHSLVAGPDVDE